jgi:hypothetical protein
MHKRVLSYVVVAFVSAALVTIFQPFAQLPTLAQAGCQTYPQTGKTVCGRFLQYWQQHGGLAQQGYPITNQFIEVSDLNGKSYTVQYFERAVFEQHPENAAPYDVLLSQLGTFQLDHKYAGGDPSGGAPPPPVPQPPAPTQPAAPPSGGTQTFTGNGTQVTQPFQLKAGLARWHAISSSGSDNFIVYLLDDQGHELNLIANEIGASDTTRAYNVPKAGTFLLSVRFEGNWTITVQQ